MGYRVSRIACSLAITRVNTEGDDEGKGEENEHEKKKVRGEGRGGEED